MNHVCTPARGCPASRISHRFLRRRADLYWRVPRRPLRTLLFPAIAAGLVILLSGCGVVGGASATKTPTSTATPTATSTFTPTATPLPTDTPTPAPTATPVPLVSSDELPQGRTIVVRVAKGDAASATLTFRGQTHPMMVGHVTFWVPLGAAPETAIGDTPVSVSRYDADGNVIDTRSGTVSVTATDFPIEALDVPTDGPNGLQPPDQVQKELGIRVAVYAGFTPQMYWDGPFILPVPGEITTAFGTARSYNGGPPSIHHSGTDFAAKIGDPVKAASAGRVAFAGMLTTRGLSVMIDHGAGVFTAYHHLSQIEVAEGAMVQQGELIAKVGMTGLATGPHLHWELVVGGVNVDPVYWTFAGVAP
jgi:murein DD-endopeptidase MepM/ murein hydrolase activator NlpD